MNGSNVKSDGQVMQLEIDERIEDATLRRQGTEAELTYPGRGWDGKVIDATPVKLEPSCALPPLFSVNRGRRAEADRG